MHQDLCEGCLQKKTNHPDPTRPRYCKKHQCPAEEAPGRPCSIRKKSAEAACPAHYVVPCKKEGCKATAFDTSLYCELHSCSHRGCKKEARPGKGHEFCDDHKCTEINCQFARKRVEVGATLKLVPYCRRHECQANGCLLRRYQDKGYCATHCCKEDGCPEPKLGGPIGDLCGKHYDEMVGKKMVEEYELQKAAEERKRAAKEAKEKEEEEKIQRRYQEEVERREQERLRQKAAKEAKEKEEREEILRQFQEETERKEKERLREQARQEQALKEALEALELKAAKERDHSPKTTYSSGRDSGISFEPHRRDGKIIYVKQVYSDDDEAYISSSGAGRREEYDRTGRKTHARARRPSTDFYDGINGW